MAPRLKEGEVVARVRTSLPVVHAHVQAYKHLTVQRQMGVMVAHRSRLL